PLCPLLRHSAPVEQAALLPRGTKVRTVSGGFVNVWDVAGAKLLSAVKLSDSAHGLAFSMDGRRLLSGELLRVWSTRLRALVPPRVWDVRLGPPLTALVRHPGEVLSAQFTPEGSRLVTTSKRPYASGIETRIWDTVPAGVERPL